MKKSFTLLELIVVVFLISTVYFLLFSNFTFSKKEETNLKIENLKNYLFDNFKYKNSLALYCIDKKSFPCYVFIDGKQNYNVGLISLFTEVPEVYSYNKDLPLKEFENIDIEDEEYSVFFSLKFDSGKKHENLVLDTEDKVYLFSSITNKVQIFEDTNSIIDSFMNKEEEVKDAF